MAALAGMKDSKPNTIIKAILLTGLEEADNAIYQEFVSYGIDEAFWKMTAQGCGFTAVGGSGHLSYDFDGLYACECECNDG